MAARASTPTPWPTTAVSTTVYSCWKTLPSIRGRAKVMSSLVGLPSVMLLIRFDMVSPFQS